LYLFNKGLYDLKNKILKVVVAQIASYQKLSWQNVVKFLTILLLSQPLAALSQSKLDIAISNLKKLWSESARYPNPSKIYFNKPEKLIDLGKGEGFQIPIDATVIYVYDPVYKPPGHGLKFSWTTPNPNANPSLPNTKTIERSFELLFKTKDGCYSLIDAIFEIRKAYEN